MSLYSACEIIYSQSIQLVRYRDRTHQILRGVTILLLWSSRGKINVYHNDVCMKQQIIRSRIVYLFEETKREIPPRASPNLFRVNTFSCKYSTSISYILLLEQHYITDQKANPTQHTLVIISSFSLLNSLWGSGVRVETERERDTRRRGTPLPPP